MRPSGTESLPGKEIGERREKYRLEGALQEKLKGFNSIGETKPAKQDQTSKAGVGPRGKKNGILVHLKRRKEGES